MFIPALLVSTCAVALYEKLGAVSEEGAIACVAVGLISTVTAIVVAPWQCHLLLVLAILALRFRPSNQVTVLGQSQESDQVLKISYILRKFW